MSFGKKAIKVQAEKSKHFTEKDSSGRNKLIVNGILVIFAVALSLFGYIRVDSAEKAEKNGSMNVYNSLIFCRKIQEAEGTTPFNCARTFDEDAKKMVSLSRYWDSLTFKMYNPYRAAAEPIELAEQQILVIVRQRHAEKQLRDQERFRKELAETTARLIETGRPGFTYRGGQLSATDAARMRTEYCYSRFSGRPTDLHFCLNP